MTVNSLFVIFANAEEAERIARTAVEERLAACVNILGDVRSIYRWNEIVESSQETAAIFKTSSTHADRLIERIAELHSYEVPCISSWPVDRILTSYAAFVEQCLSPSLGSAQANPVGGNP